jgi:hypothetical protein
MGTFREQNSSDTIRLLELARSGDRVAVNELFTRHRERLHRMVDTIRYMPPEAFEGKVDGRGDVYALERRVVGPQSRRHATGERQRLPSMRRSPLERCHLQCHRLHEGTLKSG